MADPHSMLLPSSVELVQAFLKDLQNVLEGSGTIAPAGEQTTVAMTQTNTSVGVWSADADYILVGVVMFASGSSDMTLSTDATPPGGTGFFAAATKVYTGNILAAAKALVNTFSFPPMRIRIRRGTRLSLQNQSVNTGECLLFLEKT